MSIASRTRSSTPYDAEQLIQNVFNGVPWIDFIIRYRKVDDPLWKQAGSARLEKIFYLMSYQLSRNKKEPPAIDDLKFCYYEENSLLNKNEIADYLDHMPNVELVDFGAISRWDIWISDALRSRPKLYALRFTNEKWLSLMTHEMADKSLHHIRCLSSPVSEGSKLVRHAHALEQLFIPDKIDRDCVDTILSRATKLRRLHMTISFANISLSGSNTRTNSGIEMLEVCLSQTDHNFKELETFLNRFRRLKSLYVNIASHKFDGVPIKSATQLHASLENLVITFSSSAIIRDWNGFEMFILKCKGLKRLAIRNCCILTPDDIGKLVQNLPKLLTFDIRGCNQIKRPISQIIGLGDSLKKRINFVQNNNQCYIRDPSPIQTGFDFMKNIFYQEFVNIPQFLLRRH